MSAFDWSVVVVLNGAIIVYGLYLGRKTTTSTDWFLAGRTLPWWMVGLSMYATAIDASDLVADSGGTYTLGISYFIANWVGITVGWVLCAHFIVLPMYRAGMYTNAEYLEARFGPAARTISAVVQVQYRTLVLGIMATTIYLTLRIVCDWGLWESWFVVLLIALLATVYTTWGGLRSVAVTDALQAIVMGIAALTLFAIIWTHVGGWTGTEQKLSESNPEYEPNRSARLTHVRHDDLKAIDVSEKSPAEIANELLLGGDYLESEGLILRRTPGWLMSVAFIIMGIAYSVVNHTQAMRMFGSRSEWDLKMSIVVASLFMLAFTFFNLSMGIMGRAIYPDPAGMDVVSELRHTDATYPLLIRDFASARIAGLTGIVVAGVLAASFSTFDSIGSTLSALLTRDIYSRWFVTDGTDEHYLRVGRWFTPAIIFGSFAYVPFLLSGGMLLFYLDLVSAFVIPLLTIYLMGIFTRVHRRSGTIGLLVGVLYGVCRLIATQLALGSGVLLMPAFLLNESAAYLYSMFLTAGTMVVVSLICGWEQSGKLLHEEAGGWLRSSQLEVRQLHDAHKQPRSNVLPVVLGIVVVAIGLLLSFVVFW